MKVKHIKHFINYKALPWIVKKWPLFVVAACFVAGAWFMKWTLYTPNTVFTLNKKELLIEENASYDDLIKILDTSFVLKSPTSFKFCSRFFGLEHKFKPGLFHLEKGMTNRELVQVLSLTPRKHVVSAVGKFRFRRYMTKGITRPLDIKSTSVNKILSDSEFVASVAPEMDIDNIYVIFIEDSIPLFENSLKEEVVESLYRNYKKYWSDKKRLKQARKIGLTPIEVNILASIVSGETKHEDEMPRIAGLYMNRLKDSIRLQADPTVMYAIGQRAVRRIKKRHTRSWNKYNTYRYDGLPPGPVHSISKAAIDAVLNYERHGYYFFCAKPDFSGYHDFSRTYREHRLLAKSYRKTLNKKGIH